MNQNETSSPAGEFAFQIQRSELQAEVDAAADFGICPHIDVEVLSTTPYFLLVSPKAGEQKGDLSNALGFIASKYFQTGGKWPLFLFRGVKLNRLAQIKCTDCDVVPSTAPIYSSPYPPKRWNMVRL